MNAAALGSDLNQQQVPSSQTINNIHNIKNYNNYHFEIVKHPTKIET